MAIWNLDVKDDRGKKVGGVRFYGVKGFNYGTIAAILNFCRFSAFTTSVCRRLQPTQVEQDGGSEWNAALEETFLLLRTILQDAPPRTICIQSADRGPHIVLFVDARPKGHRGGASSQ